MNEKLTQCPLCNNSKGANPFLSCRDELVSHKLFHVEQCRNCGFLYTNPRPNILNISDYYQSDEYISHQDKPASMIDKLYLYIRKVMMRRKSRLIRSLIPQGSRLLDVGCGTGAFLEAMRHEGYHVQGVEPAETPRKYTQSKGIQVVNDIYSVFSDRYSEPDILDEDIDSEEDKGFNDPIGFNKKETPQVEANLFSCITLWHVLEHMHDFKEQLNRCRQLLTNDGYLIVALPMYQSLDAAYYKHHWAAYDLPRHLFHFDNKSFKTAVELSGFTVKKINNLPFDSFYISILSESYRKRLPKPIGYLRAFTVGLLSNLAAATGRQPASSQIFICQKTV